MKKYLAPLRTRFYSHWTSIFFVLLGGICSIHPSAYAQNRVSATIRVLPPYSTRLSDYADQPEKTLITLRSFTQSPLRVQLIGSITGENGIEIRTAPQFKSQPIDLNYNAPLNLNADIIRNLFDVNKLVITGITKQALVQANGLPEGTYTICIQVLDYQTGEPLSDEEPMGCSNPISVTSLEPPILIKPMCGEDTIRGGEIQNVLFTWALPAGAPPTTEYTLKVVEMLDPRKNPNDAFLSATTPPFFEQTVTANAFLLGPAQPTLVSGRRYAFAVTAHDPFGTKVFRNEGRSEVCSFVYRASSGGAGGSLSDLPIKDVFDNQVIPRYLIPKTKITGRVRWSFRKSESTGGILGSIKDHVDVKVVTGTTLQNAISDPSYGPKRYETVNAQVFGGMKAFTVQASNGGKASQAAISGSSLVERIVENKPIGTATSIPVFGGGSISSLKISDVVTRQVTNGPLLSDLFNERDTYPMVNTVVRILVPSYLNGGNVLAVGRTDEEGNFSIEFVNPNDNPEHASYYSHVLVQISDGHFIFSETKVSIADPSRKEIYAGLIKGIAKTYRLTPTVQDAEDPAQPITDAQVQVFRASSWYGDHPSQKPEGNLSASRTEETVNGATMTQIGTKTLPRSINRLFINNEGYIDRYFIRVQAKGYETMVTPLAATPMGDYENGILEINQTYKLQPKLPSVAGRVTRADNHAPMAGVTVVLRQPSSGSYGSLVTHTGSLASTYNIGVVKAADGSSKPLAGSVYSGLMNELYRVEVSASSNDTRLVFGDGLQGKKVPTSAGSSLLFDEADAILGKRTTIQDAHDKYANQEVGSIKLTDYNVIIAAIPVEGYTYATAVTDANGYYSIANMKPNAKPYDISVMGKNIKSTEPNTVLLNAKGITFSQDLTVNMTMVQVSGKVINDQGQPLSNAQVRWKSGSDPVFTQADGQFTINSVPGADVLSVRKIGHNDRDSTVIISSAAAQNLGTITLKRLVGRLLVTVRDSLSKSPIAGAVVFIGEDDFKGTTTSNGQVYLTGNIGGNVAFKVRGPASTDYIPTQARTLTVSYAGDTTRLMVSLSIGARVTGTVRAGGSAVAGARVRVEGREDLEAITTADGSYTLAGVPLGEYTLKATKSGLVGASETRTLAKGNTTIHFNLTNAGVNITTLLGFPIEVESFSEATMTLSGAFVNLPSNGVFKVKEGTRLPFANLKVRRVGSGLEPVSGEVLTDVTEMRLKAFDYLISVAKNASGIVVKKRGADANKGQISAKTSIDYAASLGNLAGWSFQSPEAQYLTNNAAASELTFLTSDGSLPFTGDSLAIGAAGAQQLKLYGFGVTVDLSKSSIKADGMHWRGTIKMTGVPLLSSASITLAELWIGKDGAVKNVALGLKPAPTFTLASWSLTLSTASLNETGFRLGGKLDVTVPSSPTSTLDFTNLTVSTDQLFGGDFTMPAAGVNVFNIVSFKTAPLSKISFGQVGNTGVYFVSGNAVVSLPKYINQQVDIKSFTVQTDGRFAASVPANFRAGFFGLADFDISNIGFNTLGGSPSVDVTGSMTLNAIPFVTASVGGIHFRPGGSVSVDQLNLGFNIASVADIKVGVGFVDNTTRKGFEGNGSIKVGGTPFGGAIRFHYFSTNGGGVDFGADFMANIPPIVLSPTTTITKVGGGFGYSYDAVAGKKKFRITVRGAMAVAPGTDLLLALDPLEVTVESGPVIQGFAAVTVLSQQIASARLVIDLPQTLFSLEAKFGVGFLEDIGVESTAGSILVISGKPNDTYWIVGSYFKLSVLGLINNNGSMVAGWNLNIDAHPELAAYTTFIPGEYRTNGNKLNGVHYKALSYYGRQRADAVCGSIADVAGGCIWLYNSSEAMIHANLVMPRLGISVGAGWGGGADITIAGKSIAGFDISAALSVRGSFSPSEGWYFNGRANAHLAAWFGDCTQACENKICWGACFDAPCLPDVWNECEYCPIPVGGKICINPGLEIGFSTKHGVNVGIDL